MAESAAGRSPEKRSTFHGLSQQGCRASPALHADLRASREAWARSYGGLIDRARGPGRRRPTSTTAARRLSERASLVSADGGEEKCAASTDEARSSPRCPGPSGDRAPSWT